MRFHRIQVTNFRNLHSVDIQLNSRVNVFFGENAQGKTNLLETIYTLTHGKSFRTSEIDNLIMDSSHFSESSERFARVYAHVEKNNLLSKMQMVLTKEQKTFLLNDKKISSGALSKHFSSVLFSPESLSVIKNSDKERRDLIDEVVESVFPEKSKPLREFKKALQQRNRLLRDMKEGKIEISTRTLPYLESLTDSYLRISSELCVARIESIHALHSFLVEALCFILEISSVDISVEYVISGEKMSVPDSKLLFDAMYKRWMELKTAEIKSGHSLVGPHKHDVSIIFEGKDSRFYCSQGQQRLIILAFKMAQIRLHYRIHGVYPILLLDDVLSEIDEKKRIKLIEYLEKINAQIFMTTTENTVLNYLSRESLAVYNVEKGVIKSGSVGTTGNAQEDLSVR